MRQQYRDAQFAQHETRHAAKQGFAPPPMAIGAHDEEIGLPRMYFSQQPFLDALITFCRDGYFGADAMAR